MKATTYLRRIDDELVEAVQYTGHNRDEVRALVGAGYRVPVDGWDEDPARASGTRRSGLGRAAVSTGESGARPRSRPGP